MKNLYLTLLIALGVSSINAQITLTQTDFPSPGTSVKVFEKCVGCSTVPGIDTLINLGAGGANDTYDFSNMMTIGYDQFSTITYAYPFETPMGDDHQMANLAILEESVVDLDGNDLERIYLYFMSTSTQLKFVGLSAILDSAWIGHEDDSLIPGASGVIDSVASTANINGVMLSTDFVYGYVGTDSISFSLSLFNGWIKYTETNIMSVEVDGWGTLTTGSMGSFNVLRFKITEINEGVHDSSGIVTTDKYKKYYYEYWAKGVGHPLVIAEMDSLWKNIQDVEWVEYIYAYGDTLCSVDCVWPGDANNDSKVDHYDILPIGVNYNGAGPVRDHITNHWMALDAPDWPDTLWNGANLKHNDCNGDSLIDASDVDAIKQNFQMPRYKSKSVYNPANPDLYFEIITDDIAPGSNVEIAVMAGRDSISTYGLGFEIQLDPSIIAPNTLGLNWTNCWVGTAGTDMLVIKKFDESTGLAMGGCVRNTGTNMTNFGEIARVTFTVNSNLDTTTQNFEMTVSSQGGVDSSGTGQQFNSSSDTITLSIKPKISLGNLRNVRIYPNPTTGLLSVDLPGINEKFEITIVNLLGQEVYQVEKSEGGKAELNIGNLPEDLYFISVKTKRDIFVKKIIVVR